jgi:hypothetical protein
MKNISTGFGLALLAGAILAYPFVSSLAPSANASAVTAAASAVSTAVTGQTGPTIVWYGVAHNPGGLTANNNWHFPYTVVTRAWSDGRIEAKKICTGSNCGDEITAGAGWAVVSTAESGYNAASDINFDERVDGADLGQLLADWGDAPRQDLPPSECPLALINP